MRFAPYTQEGMRELAARIRKPEPDPTGPCDACHGDLTGGWRREDGRVSCLDRLTCARRIRAQGRDPFNPFDLP